MHKTRAQFRSGFRIAFWLLLLLVSLSWSVYAGWRARPLPEAMPQLPSARLGANVELTQYSDTELEAELQFLADHEFVWLRQRFPWAEIEAAPEVWHWEPWDRIVEAVAKHENLHLIAALHTSPTWARRLEDAGNPFAPPQARADFGRFVQSFAARYGHVIDHYQIWHEPNIAPNWGARLIAPSGYAGLLREARHMIRAVDPDAVILLAALAPNTEPGGLNMSDVVFLEGLYAHGAQGAFDAVAGQAMGFDLPPEESPAADRLNFRRVELLRNAMVRHGDSHKPLWITTFGWAHQPDTPWRGVSGRTQQAEYAARAISWAQRHWPWAGPLLWHTWEQKAEAHDPAWAMALRSRDLDEPSPTLAALAVHASADVLSPGQHTFAHPALEFEGEWRRTPEAVDVGQSGDRLRIPFWGAGLQVQVQRGPYWAFLDVEVNGVPAANLPQHSDRAYLLLYDPEGKREWVSLVHGLPFDRHEAVLTAHGGWGQWTLTGVRVLGDEPTPWSRTPLVLGVLGAGAAVLGLAWTLRGATFFLPRLLTALPPRKGRGLGPKVCHRQRGVFFLWTTAVVGLVALITVWWVTAPILRLAALVLLGLTFVFAPALTGPAIALTLPTAPVLLDVGIGRFILPELVTWIAAGALAVQVLAQMKWKTVDTPAGSPSQSWAGWLLALLLVTGLGATVPAERTHEALREVRTVFVLGLVAYLVVRWSSSRIWWLVDALVAGAVLVAALSLAQALTGQGLIEAGGVQRVRALYGSPNNLALYLERVLPLLLAVAWRGHGPRRAVYALAFVLVGATLLLTLSRGALLLGVPAGMLTVVAGIWLWKRRYEGYGMSRWAVVAAVTAVIVLLAVLGLLGFMGEQERGTASIRVQVWQSAWNMAMDHFWTGVGPDNFLSQYRSRYALPTMEHHFEELNHPHNLFLDFLTRLGVPGLLAGVMMLLYAAHLVWRGWWQSEHGEGERERRVLALGLGGGLAAGAAHGLVDQFLFLPDLMLYWVIALAVLEKMGDRQ